MVGHGLHARRPYVGTGISDWCLQVQLVLAAPNFVKLYIRREYLEVRAQKSENPCGASLRPEAQSLNSLQLVIQLHLFTPIDTVSQVQCPQRR